VLADRRLNNATAITARAYVIHDGIVCGQRLLDRAHLCHDHASSKMSIETRGIV
jgi:hypothetical protein